MAFRIINVILANALLRLACLLPTANGFLAVNTVSSSAGVADVFLYSYSFPAVEVPTTATTVNCELSVPGLSYTLTRPGSVLQTTNGSQVECTFMDVRQRSLVRADLNLYDINDNALAVRSVWFGSPVLSTLKCSGYGLSSFRGYDDFGDLALVATDENIPFCTGTAGQRKTLSDDVWRGINGLYASNDLALMAKTQARFLDCYRTCGHTLDRKYFRSKRCQRFLLYSPTLLQITDSVNLYSGSVNSANPKHLSWSISQACLGLAPCFDKLVGSRLLQAYFSRNVTSDVGIPLVLFDSLVNEVPIFRDYVAFVAMGQKGQVNVFVDNDIYSIIPGTAFASILDALFLYNKAVTSINIRMQAQNPAVPATTNRCSQFNAMLETYLPTASVRACGTGRMTVPAWSCTEEGVANTFRSSRLVLSSYFAGSHLYVPTSYYPVMVDTDTSEAVPLILPRRRPEFRFAAPLSVTFPATDLRFRIPYTALTLQGSGQPLAASSVTPGSVAPVMTILPTTTYTRLVDPSATVLTTISGRLTTGTTELIANFPLATRGFTGETNVTLDIYFRLSYGSGGATIDGSTRLVIMLTAGPLPKHALTNITDASDSTKLFFTRMRASNASLFSNVTYDVTTYDVQGLPSILPFSKVASIHSIFNHSALTVLQNLPPDSTALGNVNSSYVFNPIRRHQLVYSTSVRDQLGIVITSLEDSINALNLKVLATSSFQSYALRSQFRWFAQEPSSAITRTDISKIDLPGVWLLQTNVGQIAIISVDWTESYSIYNNAHPVEFMLLVGLIEYIRLQRGCPVIVTGDFENEFRYMSTSTSYNTPGTSFASSWLRDLFQITSFPSANLDIAGSLWPLNVTYNNTMLRSLTATRPSSGNWYDHIWAPFSPLSQSIVPVTVNSLSANLSGNAALGSCNIVPTTSCSREYSNHMPVIYNISMGAASISLASFNTEFFDVPGASRLDFARPTVPGSDEETLDGNSFASPRLWSNLGNRLKFYLQSFDLVLLQEENPNIRARSEKPFIQGFEYSNIDINAKGIYAKKDVAHIQPGGTSTCTVISYTWEGTGTVVNATVDTNPDWVEELNGASRNGRSSFNINPTLLACGFWALAREGTTGPNDQPFIAVNVQDRRGYNPLSTTGAYRLSDDAKTKLRSALYNICTSLKAQSGRGGLDCGVTDTVEQKITILFVGDWNTDSDFAPVAKPNTGSWQNDMVASFRANAATVSDNIAKRLGFQCLNRQLHIPGDVPSRLPNNLNCDAFDHRLPFTTTGKGLFRDFLFYCGPSAVAVVDSKIDGDLGIWDTTACPADLSGLDELQILNCRSTDIMCSIDADSDHRAVRMSFNS